MRLTRRSLSIRLGKAPLPAPSDTDPMSRLARAYGVRRDHFELRDAIANNISVPHRFTNLNRIGQVIVNVIGLPGGLDRVVTGHSFSAGDRRRLEAGVPDEQLVEAVLSDIRTTVSAGEEPTR